jgi:hypothetical protein
MNKTSRNMRKVDGDSLSEPKIAYSTSIEFDPILTANADEEASKQWLRKLCCDFGLGFHPDTPASDYKNWEGLALLIDEAESVVTKLPPFRSRNAAMRVLAALCEAKEFGNLVTVLALTPDADQQLRDESHSYDVAGCHGSYEPMHRFLAHLRGDKCIAVDCKVLKANEIRELLGKIRSVYLQAYPDAHNLNAQHLEEWDGYIYAARIKGLPLRLLIRQAVDFLDAQRDELMQTS